MPRQVTTEIIDTPEGKQLRMREVRTRQRELRARQVEQMIAGMDRRITGLQRDLANVQAERDDLADKLAQMQAAPQGA